MSAILEIDERQRWAESAEAMDARAAHHGRDTRATADQPAFVDTIPALTLADDPLPDQDNGLPWFATLFERYPAAFGAGIALAVFAWVGIRGYLGNP